PAGVGVRTSRPLHRLGWPERPTGSPSWQADHADSRIGGPTTSGPVVALSPPLRRGYASTMTSLPPPESGHEPGDPGPVEAGWATATGPRPDNQDRVAVGSRWAVVGDGVGGQEGGAVAAELAVEAAAGVLAS